MVLLRAARRDLIEEGSVELALLEDGCEFGLDLPIQGADELERVGAEHLRELRLKPLGDS